MQQKIPILILRLDGVLQSWGEHSKWDIRDTSDMPTKSAVIGMIACALGIERGDGRIVRLNDSLNFSIREDCHGSLITDFQTAQADKLLNAQGKPRSSSNTIIAQKSYIQDAAFTVALTGEVELLKEIELAFTQPKWPVYLGRKSCVPSRPVFDGIYYDYCSPEQAFCSIPLIRQDKHDVTEVIADFEYDKDVCATLYVRTDGVDSGIHNFKNRRVMRKKITLEHCDAKEEENVSQQSKT